MGGQLREANRLHFERIQQALAGYREQNLFKPLPVDCFTSLIIGPAHDFTRNWLAGRTHTELAACRELLAQSAWESVRA
ncbi:hypothetical protein FQZ97_894370 [compost metagenome]